MLITAETGSGKTVLVPKFALHASEYKGKWAITLPKQIIAKSSAEFAAKTLDVKLGDHVGYQYKGSAKSAKSNKRRKSTKILNNLARQYSNRHIFAFMLHSFA